MAQRDWIEKDFYKVLGVDSKASKDEIKRAYRKLAQRYHPDAAKDDRESERRFKEVSEAYAILSNDEKRREYDQMRQYATTGGGFPFGFRPGSGERVRVDIGDLFGDGGMGDVFEDFFGFSSRPRRGQDLEAEAHLSFEEAMSGTTLELAGGAKVRVPRGVTDGARIKVPRKGGPAPPGGEPGDLFVRVHVAPHPLFTPDDKGNLVVTVPLTIAEAALGARVHVPTLEEPVTVKVPPGSSSGKTLRLKGKGAPKAGGGRGDLLVKLEIEVPRNLSRKEKELLEQFAREHKGSPRAHLEHWMTTSRAGSREAS